jgi:hypothetical protein
MWLYVRTPPARMLDGAVAARGEAQGEGRRRRSGGGRWLLLFGLPLSLSRLRSLASTHCPLWKPLEGLP